MRWEPCRSEPSICRERRGQWQTPRSQARDRGERGFWVLSELISSEYPTGLVLKINFIEVQCMYDAIYPFYWQFVYTWVTTTTTEIVELSITPNSVLTPCVVNPPIAHSSSCPGKRLILFPLQYINFACRKISYKWNHTEYTLLYVFFVCFIQNIAFEIPIMF